MKQHEEDQKADPHFVPLHVFSWLNFYCFTSRWLISRLRLCPADFSDDEWARGQLAAIEDARALQAAIVRIGDLLFAVHYCEFAAQAARGTHLLKLHLRHARRRVVEPLAHDHLAIVRAIVCRALTEALHDERVSQKPVTELRHLLRRLIALRGGQDEHALLVSKLREALRVHRPQPLVF